MATTGARVGERLRAIRRQKGLSLHDVEARSTLEFKASVLGAYERGERAISVPRLLRLAEIYEVPADQLLPREFDGEISLVDGATSSIDQANGFAIDLVRLHDVDDPDELAQLAHAPRVGLGPYVLKAETAPIAAAALLLDRAREMFREWQV